MLPPLRELRLMVPYTSSLDMYVRFSKRIFRILCFQDNLSNKTQRLLSNKDNRTSLRFRNLIFAQLSCGCTYVQVPASLSTRVFFLCCSWHRSQLVKQKSRATEAKPRNKSLKFLGVGPPSILRRRDTFPGGTFLERKS